MALLTVAVSSRTLFDIEDGHQIFLKEGQDAFDAYMFEKRKVPLRPGIAFNLVKKLLALNSVSGFDRDAVDIAILSRNSHVGGWRVLNSVQHYGLNIEKAVFTTGGDRFAFAKGLGAELMLSANAEEVKRAVEHGIPAAVVSPGQNTEAMNQDCDSICFMFDGDSVIFDDSSDRRYKEGGLAAFRQSAIDNANVPMGPGPLHQFLMKLVQVRELATKNNRPVKLSLGLLTARGLPAHEQVLTTLHNWGVFLDTSIFAGGFDKGPLLKAAKADMFFDDTFRNVQNAREHGSFGAHVPFGAGGIVQASN